MLNPKIIPDNKKLVPRPHESNLLTNIGKNTESSIIVVYGRRRVGKTELLEQTFKNRHILKFEGLEGLDQAKQIANVMWQLSEYAENPLIAKLKLDTWKEVFKVIADEISQGVWTLYFEEVQWLANYEDPLDRKSVV